MTTRYLAAAVTLVYDGNPADAIAWETDRHVLSLKPPDDLMRRLGALPQSYLRQRKLTERLRLTADPATANQSLDDAINQRSDSGDTGTAWPEIHHLGPQHPVLEWIADKLLYRLKRDEAIAIPCGVSEPTLLVSGVWSNKLGEPIAAAWLAATVEDGLATFEDMHAALASAGVTDGMVNPQWVGDLDAVRALVPPVVNAAESWLTDQLLDQLAPIEEQLNQTRARLERWQQESRAVADAMNSDVHKRRRLDGHRPPLKADDRAARRPHAGRRAARSDRRRAAPEGGRLMPQPRRAAGGATTEKQIPSLANNGYFSDYYLAHRLDAGLSDLYARWDELDKQGEPNERTRVRNLTRPVRHVSRRRRPHRAGRRPARRRHARPGRLARRREGRPARAERRDPHRARMGAGP